MVELPVDGVFFADGCAYAVKKAPKRLWPCQTCAFYDKCSDPEFFKSVPRCKKDLRSDKTPVVYVEADKYEGQ